MNLIPNFKKRIEKKFHKIFLERFEYKYKELSDQIVDIKKDTIPNIVYQTWVNNLLPWRLHNGVQQFRKLNNKHSFLLFTHEDRDEYMKVNWAHRPIYKIYKNAVFHPCKADIWRYCILYDRGGFYFDIKSACNIPLSDLLISKGATLTYESNISIIQPSLEILNLNNYHLNLIANWGFGFQKNHPLLKIIISNIEKSAFFFKGKNFSNPKSAILSFTGPGMVTKSYIDYLKIFKEEITFNNIDFFGKGVYSLKGAEYRYKLSSCYGKVKNQSILK